MPFIIQSHPSERQECFLHGCVWEGNLFPLSCSTGDRRRHGWQWAGGASTGSSPGGCIISEVINPGHLCDTCVTLVWQCCVLHRVPSQLLQAEWLLRSGCLGPQSPLWLRHLEAAGQHWGANSFAAVRYSEKSLQTVSWLLTLVLLSQPSSLASTTNILLCRKGKCPYEVG